MTCHWWWTWPEEQLIVLNITDGTGPDSKAGDGAIAYGGEGVCKLVCTEPVQLHLTSMMMLARIGKRGMVRTLVGECTASLSWPQGWVCQLVCGEPVQLHLTLMMVLARIGKRRMVRTLVGECTASLSWPQGVCVWVGLRWTSTVALNIDDGASPDWEAGDGAHTRRGVHGILELTMGWVGLPWTSDDSTTIVFTVHRKGMLARHVW